MFNVEEYQRLYPEWNGGFTLLGAVRVVVVVVVFFVLPYLYIRFVEERLKIVVMHAGDRIGGYLRRLRL